MLVAGSVAAMLLMGLALDAFMNSSSEDGDAFGADRDGANGAAGGGDENGEEYEDVSGTHSSALEDLLFGQELVAPEDDASSATEFHNAAPAGDVSADVQDDRPQRGGADKGDDVADAKARDAGGDDDDASAGTSGERAEGAAWFTFDAADYGDDAEYAGINWPHPSDDDAVSARSTVDAAASDDTAPTQDDPSVEGGEAQDGGQDLRGAALSSTEEGFVEIEDLTLTADGDEVAYITEFYPETDALVLEFDGADAPEIEVDLSTEEDAAVVLANGSPVALIEGGADVTPNHVQVVMADAGMPGQEISAPDVSEPTASAAEAKAGTEFDPVAPLEGPQDDGTATVAEDIDAVSPEGKDPFGGLPVPQITTDDVLNSLPNPEEVEQVMNDLRSAITGADNPQTSTDARAAIDPIFGSGGVDALTGSFNNDVLTGSDTSDAMFGDEGDDHLSAGAGNDEIHGDTGNDNLDGGDGVDFLSGGDGSDTLNGGADDDVLFGGDGADALNGGHGDDILTGGRGADMLNGGSGDDLLDGTHLDGRQDIDGADTLIGGDGQDTIIVGAGDMARGGEGADTFVGGVYVDGNALAGAVSDFDPSADQIEVLFDPAVTPDPVLSVEDFVDGSGADILLNGEVILSVVGAQGLDPSAVDLRPV